MKKLEKFAVLLLAFVMLFCMTAVSFADMEDDADGTVYPYGVYEPASFEVVSGGSGKVTLTCDKIHIASRVYADITISSVNYTSVKVGDEEFLPYVDNEAGTTTFRVPVKPDKEVVLNTHTTSMGGKDIEYTVKVGVDKDNLVPVARKPYQDGFYTTTVSTFRSMYGYRTDDSGKVTQIGIKYPSADYVIPVTVQIKDGKIVDVAYTVDVVSYDMGNTSSDCNYLLWAMDGRNVSDYSYNYLNKAGANYDTYHLDPHPIKNGKGMKDQIVEKNDVTGVDTVTSATLTSRAIIDSVDQSLTKAERGLKDDPEPVLPKPDTTPDIIPEDGLYTATVKNVIGFTMGNDGELLIEVKDGKMAAKLMYIEQRQASYPYIFPGTEAEALAAGEEGWLVPEDYDYGYKYPGSLYKDVPLKSLDKPLRIMMNAKSSGNWFNRFITVDSTTLKPVSEYAYGTVNMDYADFYYGELKGIEPSEATVIDKAAEDPVTNAGYREEGFYDAATLATPKGFIYETKWKEYPGTYYESIYDDWGNLVGGKILGVEDVNVAVKWPVYYAAMAAPDSVIGKKAAEIKLLEDQSKVPLSYKVLNADGVYSKYVNLTDPVETDLDGYLTTEFMGDDIWWEGRAMKHTKEQTILGGVIEYKKNPLDPDEEPVVLGLKHDENMYSDTWIGWGMGPGNVGIYGGNETGWQRFSGIAGKYLTKMSYILMEEDGSVHYYNASYNAAADPEGKQMKDLLHTYVPSAVVDENGEHPYSAGITDYEFTKDRIKIDLAISVPLRADGTMEAGYYLYSVNCPGGTASKARHESNPEQIPVFEESEWVNGRKTYHIEINRKYEKADGTYGYYGTGRYKFWFDIDPDYEKRESDRPFTGVAAWKMLYTDETPDDIYMKDGKLVVKSDIFTVEDYINNPYQQVEVYKADGELVGIFATGDANTNTSLFAGTTMQNGAAVAGLFNKDGSINLAAQKYSYNRRSGSESLQPVFEEGNGTEYNVVLYSGGFPIVKGTVKDNRTKQTITASAPVSEMKFGDDPVQITAEAKTGLLYLSSNPKVASVDKDGKITAVAEGECEITVMAVPSDQYFGASATLSMKVAAADQEIVAPDTLKFVIGDEAKALGAEAKTEIKYETDNAEIATVDETGLVTPVAIGSCKIKITAAGTSQYNEAVKEVKVTVSGKAAKITAKKKAFTVKLKNVKKKAQKVTFQATSTSGGKLTYSGKGANSKSKKALKVASNGKITVKKGTKKGTYKATVTVKSAAKGDYAAATQKFTVTIKVK